MEEHESRKKDSSIVDESQKVIPSGRIRGVWLLLLLIFLLVPLYFVTKETIKERKKEAAAEAAAAMATTGRGGAITIVAPAIGFSRGVVVKPGAGACVSQGDTLVKSSRPVTLRTHEGMKTLTEFPGGPHISNEFGEIPEGTIFRYQSRTTGNVTVRCFNVTVV
jgi:hypothetical protein